MSIASFCHGCAFLPHHCHMGAPVASSPASSGTNQWPIMTQCPGMLAPPTRNDHSASPLSVGPIRAAVPMGSRLAGDATTPIRLGSSPCRTSPETSMLVKYSGTMSPPDPARGVGIVGQVGKFWQGRRIALEADRRPPCQNRRKSSCIGMSGQDFGSGRFTRTRIPSSSWQIYENCSSFCASQEKSRCRRLISP
jgi:hypothetical protein